VSRLDIHKGHDTVIRALAAVLRDIPDAAYVIVGEGPMRQELEEMSRACGVADHVVFAGYIPRTQTLALFAACDVFVMVSRIENGSTEGFGIVFLEAGAFSKPVIGGRSGGIPDAVADGESGLLVDPLAPEEVGAAISRILKDRDLASRLGRAGCHRVETEFTWERVVRKILAGMADPGRTGIEDAV
jgi:phosphatidylinositol alpha-1,6-mannosyltransferase